MLGLYDHTRVDELTETLAPLLRCDEMTLDMSNADHLDLVALAGFLPVLNACFQGRSQIRVKGMNEDIRRTLRRAGFLEFFYEIGRPEIRTPTADLWSHRGLDWKRICERRTSQPSHETLSSTEPL